MTLDHSFPPEIIREILLKATLKSLLRCKSVCKEWYTLISDQQFIKSHYTLSSTNNINYAHNKLIYTTDGPSSNLYICPLYDVLFEKPAINVLLLKNPLERRTRDLSIVGSCNGLVCLFVMDEDYDFFIFNPSTRIWNGLPARRRDDLPYFYRHSSFYSFYYDESTYDYKILEILRCTTKEVSMYSLKTGKWKIIGHYSYQNTDDHACGVFSNGALHWAALDNSYMHTIVSFELSKQTFGEVLQPVSDEDLRNLSLGVLGECLCGIYYYHKSHADLWVMKVYGVKDSWTKLASFSYVNYPWISKYPAPFLFSNDGIALIQCAMDLVVYKSKDSSFEYFDRCCKACVVVESLVSPFPPLALADNNEY